MAAPQTIDEYLAALPDDARSALEKLRGMIRAAAPAATESISYQTAAFKYHGMLVGFGASEKYCSFYVMSPPVLEAHRDQLKAYDLAKGTVHFSPARPLPAALVRKLVKARIEENMAGPATKDGSSGRGR